MAIERSGHQLRNFFVTSILELAITTTPGAANDGNHDQPLARSAQHPDPGSARAVWQEFETFDRIAAWFARGHELHRFEPKLGGQVEMSVEIFHHGFERLGADGADSLQGYEEGWDVKHLTALRAIVEH